MTPPADKDNQAGQGTAGTAGTPAPETNNGATGTPGTTAPENNQAGQGTAGTAGTPALILITVQLVLLVKQRQMVKKNQALLVLINKAKTHLKQVLLVKILKR